jgi:hypothetical protein
VAHRLSDKDRIELRRSQQLHPVKKDCALVRWSLTNEKAASNSKESRGCKGLIQEQEQRKHKGEGIPGVAQPSEESLKNGYLIQLRRSLRKTAFCQGKLRVGQLVGRNEGAVLERRGTRDRRVK